MEILRAYVEVLSSRKFWANFFQKPGMLPETTLSALKRSRPCRGLRFHFPVLILAQNWFSQLQYENEHLYSEQLYLLCFLAIHFSSQKVCSLREWYRIKILGVRYFSYSLRPCSVLKICSIKDLNYLWQCPLKRFLNYTACSRKPSFILKLVKPQSLSEIEECDSILFHILIRLAVTHIHTVLASPCQPPHRLAAKMPAGALVMWRPHWDRGSASKLTQ